MGSTSGEGVKSGLRRTDLQHGNNSAKVGNEDEGEWQRQCEHTDNQTQN